MMKIKQLTFSAVSAVFQYFQHQNSIYQNQNQGHHFFGDNQAVLEAFKAINTFKMPFNFSIFVE